MRTKNRETRTKKQAVTIALRHCASCIVHCALVYCALILVSCTDNSCYDNGSALPLVRFYASGTTRQVTVNGLTLRGLGAPGDSLLIDSTATSEVYLPLRATASNSQWVFDYPGDTDLADTLTIAYEPIPYFAGAECGAMYNFQLTNVSCTHNVIDSVQVVKPLINNGTDVALRVFFPTE